MVIATGHTIAAVVALVLSNSDVVQLIVVFKIHIDVQVSEFFFHSCRRGLHPF